MRLDSFFKLKYQSSAMRFLFGIKYAVRDLLHDVINYA